MARQEGPADQEAQTGVCAILTGAGHEYGACQAGMLAQFGIASSLAMPCMQT